MIYREKKKNIFVIIDELVFFSSVDQIGEKSFDFYLDDRTSYAGTIPLSDSVNLYKIQNFYVEILFKYMLYRYGYYQAALRFSNLLRIYLVHNLWASNHAELENHDQLVDNVAKEIEQSLVVEH